MKMPTPVLPDSDGDGVPDQFDLEPNTPKGAQVDSHGRAIDTDGDGVPDYKDKEKLTPQICFPVDSNGVGTCPEPECCRQTWVHLKDLPRPVSCNIDSLPSIIFKTGSAVLSKGAMVILDRVSQQILANPNCRVKVCGYDYEGHNYHTEQLCWDRVYTVTEYLIDTKGILNTHVIFSYENHDGDPNVVDFITTTDSGPYLAPPPSRQYSTLRNVSWQKVFDEYDFQLKHNK